MSNHRFQRLALLSVVVLLAGCVTSMPRVRETTTPDGQKVIRLERLNGSPVSLWADLDGELLWKESMADDSLHMVLYLTGPVRSTPSGMAPVMDDTLTGRSGAMPLFLPDSMMTNGSPDITATRASIPGDSSSTFPIPKEDSSFTYRTVSNQIWPRLVSVKRYAIEVESKQTHVGIGVPIGPSAAVGVTISGPVHVAPITELTYKVPDRTMDDVAANSVRAVHIALEDDVRDRRGPELQEYELGEKSAVQFRKKVKKARSSASGSSSI